MQAGQRYLLMEQWERDDLVNNFVTLLPSATARSQERMVWHLLLVEDELGLRVGEGLGISARRRRGLEPLAGQDLTDEDRDRLANLGKNGPRDVERAEDDPLRPERAGRARRASLSRATGGAAGRASCWSRLTPGGGAGPVWPC